MRASLAEIKQSHNIIDIATDLGLKPVTKRGKAMASCPLCGDTGGHLYLYDTTNRFYCFKCHASGDWIDLWTKLRNASPQDAINELKQRYGHENTLRPQKPLKIDLVRPSEPLKQAEPEISVEKLTEILLTLHNITGLTESGRDYLRKRGISERLMDMMSVCSIDEPRETGARMLDQYSLDELMAAGLFDYSTKGKPYFVFYQPAILFIHVDPECKQITSASTRNLAGDVKSFKLANRPSIPFYGDIDRSGELFVFEGIITALSYAELTGKRNFLATCGTISPAQYQNLSIRHPNHKIILGMDPDEAGSKALSAIHKCEYVNWTALASMLGFSGLQNHANGKAWDLNDYLVNRKDKS